jgi:hypothetical protein
MSISMVPPTHDDLKAIYSIEAILGMKNLDNHSQQHLFPSHLLPSSKMHQQKLGHKKRSSNEHYPDSKKILKKKKFKYIFFHFN